MSLIRVVSVVAFLFGTALAAANVASAQNCGAGQLAASLAKAAPNSTVRIGRCTVTGPFSVPAGVTLQGSGSSRTTIVAPAGTAGVLLNASASGNYTTLKDVRVNANGAYGVRITGSGNARVKNSTVTVTLGAGIAAENVSGEVEIDQVTVTGPVTSSNANSLHEAMGDVTGSHGLVLINVGYADIDRSYFNNFSQFGALIINSDTSWDAGGGSGSIEANAGFHGGTASIDAAAFTRAANVNMGDEIGSVGVGFMGGVYVHSDGMTVSDNPFFGIFMDNVASAEHEYLRADRNGLSAAWCQNSAYCEIDDASLNQNAFAGVVMVDVVSALVNQSSIRNTAIGTHAFVGTSGDGVTLMRSAGLVDSTNLTNNARAGVAIELGSSQATTDVAFSSTTVNGSGQYGVVAQQNGTPIPSYTSGISRSGNLATADSLFANGTNPLTIAGTQGPCFLPSALAIATGGLAAVFGDGGDPFPTE